MCPADGRRGRRRLRLRPDVLAAVFVGALGSFLALTALVLYEPRLAVDQAVREAAVEAHIEALVDISLTVLDPIADPDAIVPIAAATAVLLAGVRWWGAAAALALGATVAIWGGGELKELVGRERPAGALNEATNEAYPSGHARYGIFWTWLAFLLAVYLPMSRPTRRSVIALGIAVALLVGVARVYIRAHWLTDVLGGWAFAVMSFSGAALMVLAVARARPARS